MASFTVRRAQAPSNPRTGSKEGYPVIDLEFFPHIRDAILSHAPVQALRVLRATSRDLQQRVDELAPRHVELRPRDSVINVVNGRTLPSSWKTDPALTSQVRFLDFPSANSLPIFERSQCLCNCLGLYCATNLERHKKALVNLQVVRFIGDTNCYTAKFDCKKVVFIFKAEGQPHFYQAEFPFPTLTLNFRYNPDKPAWPMGSKWPMGNRAPFIPYKPRGDLVFLFTPRHVVAERTKVVETSRGTPLLPVHAEEPEWSDEDAEEVDDNSEEAAEDGQIRPARNRFKSALGRLRRVRFHWSWRRAHTPHIDDDDGFSSVINSDEGFESFLECIVNVMCWSTRTITIVGSESWDSLFPLSDGRGPRTLLDSKMAEMFCDWQCTRCTKPDDHPCRYQEGRLRLVTLKEYRAEVGEDVFAVDNGDGSGL